MSFFVFVDNSNLWIEGKYTSAVKKGAAASIFEAHEKGIQDNSWALDFGRLLYQVTETDIQDVKKAELFGSRPTDNDSLWNAAKQGGFEVKTKNRNASNKEKQIDTGVVASIFTTLYEEAKEGDVFVLVMGDSDYVPIMQKINEKKCKTVVAFWEQVSGELKIAADKYINLSEFIDRITYE